MEIERIVEAIREAAGDHLTEKDIIALARMLSDYFSDGSESYHGAVDFLWMSFRITTNDKLELLDLMA